MRRHWVYVLSLLVPFTVYSLVLKWLLIVATKQDSESKAALGLMQIRLPDPAPPRFMQALALVQSDLWFNLGYAVFWLGCVAMARTGRLRWLLIGLFHGMTIGLALIITSAYRYFTVTGSTLDFATLVLGLAAFTELRSLIASEMSSSLYALLAIVLVYAAVGPAVTTALVDRWCGGHETCRPGRDSPPQHAWATRAAGPVSGVLFACSLLPAAGPPGMSKAFARNAVVNVLVSAAAVAGSDALPGSGADQPTTPLPAEARLIPTDTTRRRNIVLIALESTRAGATTPYNATLPTTPFLAELAQQSLLVERAYAIIPHTHNALTAINCGIAPPLDAERTRLLARPDTLPEICLPHLLQAEGYNTVFFKSTVKSFEHSQQILENLGYEDVYALEDMSREGFAPTNYFGYEDEIMLAPSRAWLATHRKAPFLAGYLTSAPHHDYLAPSQRHGRVAFTDDDEVNRYLNSVRNQDLFLKQLFDQYRELGLYEETIFVLLGDHGQGFGEHGRSGHNQVIYEEGIRIPLLIHDPERSHQGARITEPATQLDILPTIADQLGYTIEGGPYGGRSLLRFLPKDRTLLFSCSGERGCVASLKGREKYIYHFDDRPDELFDVVSDPAEQNNLAGERPDDELRKRRDELLTWRASVQAMYGEP